MDILERHLKNFLKDPEFRDPNLVLDRLVIKNPGWSGYEILKQMALDPETIQQTNDPKLLFFGWRNPAHDRQLRAESLKKLANSNSTLEPFFITMIKRWNNYKKNIPVEFRLIFKVAVMNSIGKDLVALNSSKMSKSSDFNSTVFLLMDPRYLLNVEDLAIPHGNFQQFLSGILRFFGQRNVGLIPMVQPCANIPPFSTFESDLVISQHTVGEADNWLHYKIAYLGDCFYLNESGFGPYASAYHGYRDDQAYLESVGRGRVHKFLNERKTKFPQSSVDDIQSNLNDFIFFPMQTENDTVANHAFFKTDLLLHALHDYCASSGQVCVVKLHPLDDPERGLKIRKKFFDSKYITFSECSIFQLLEDCRAVVCVNSGVGLEAVLFGVPVITCGRADYSPLTVNVKTRDELIGALNDVCSTPKKSRNWEFTEIGRFFEAFTLDFEKLDAGPEVLKSFGAWG